MWLLSVNPSPGAWKRRYEPGALMRLLRGCDKEIFDSFTSKLSCIPPARVLKVGLRNLSSLKCYNTTGAQYLWAYLKLIGWNKEQGLSGPDVLLFCTTLRCQLQVLFKTISRYIMEAYRALKCLGFTVENPRNSGSLYVIKTMDYPGKSVLSPKLSFCSIS